MEICFATDQTAQGLKIPFFTQDSGFNKEMVEQIQQVHSSEIEQLQLADVLIGALGYLHRGLQTSSAKQAVIERIKDKSGFSLKRSTLPSEKKFNVFVWTPQAVE